MQLFIGFFWPLFIAFFMGVFISIFMGFFNCLLAEVGTDGQGSAPGCLCEEGLVSQKALQGEISSRMQGSTIS